MNIFIFFKVTFKLIFFIFTLFGYFLVSFLIYVFCGFNFERARPYLTKVISFSSHIGLKIFSIKIEKNIISKKLKGNYLIVSNHLSYIDIMIIGSIFPSCFITSKEMKNTLFLGQICLLGGCLFVDRKDRANLHNEVKELTHALNRGLNVAIFPEATSTDGTSVIRFRRPLFQAAIDAKAFVLPLCLNYKSISGEELTLKNRDLTFWYGEMAFLSHVLKLFAQKNIIVELTALPGINSLHFDDKVELSEKCYELVNSQYKNIVV
jgi:1-acyl-sn-glycerol-3-phosphate acyltransferase